MNVVYLGIGGNDSGSLLAFEKSIEMLKQCAGKIAARSNHFYSEPWGGVAQSRFVNIAVKLETSLSAIELLSCIKKIEQALGRDATAPRWGDRIIDIDILLYNHDAIDLPTLQIPHKHLVHRDFVLIPLAEIACEVCYPCSEITIGQLCGGMRKK